jgi:hypothetical protein
MAVHIIEVDLYSRGQKKVFIVRIARGSQRRGSNPAKLARGDHRVFSNRGSTVLFNLSWRVRKVSRSSEKFFEYNYKSTAAERSEELHFNTYGIGIDVDIV